MYIIGRCSGTHGVLADDVGGVVGLDSLGDAEVDELQLLAHL